MYDNANLTAVTFPTSSEDIELFYIHSCDLKILDLSGLSGFCKSFEVFSNSGLTAITLPVSTKDLDDFEANDCDLGYINFNDYGEIMIADNFLKDAKKLRINETDKIKNINALSLKYLKYHRENIFNQKKK